MIYLTHARLMTESEHTVEENARHGEGIPHRVCTQLISNRPRYSLWFANHDRRMTKVASLKQREKEITALRSLAVEQIHRTALVRYLRDYQVSGAARDQTLREFHGFLDVQGAVIEEHKNYLVAASSQLCALDLLEMTGDERGVEMLTWYESAYGHFFSMFCDRARAAQDRRPYLLASLIPEVKASADSLRARIVSGQRLPSKRFSGVSIARSG